MSFQHAQEACAGSLGRADWFLFGRKVMPWWCDEVKSHDEWQEGDGVMTLMRIKSQWWGPIFIVRSQWQGHIFIVPSVHCQRSVGTMICYYESHKILQLSISIWYFSRISQYQECDILVVTQDITCLLYYTSRQYHVQRILVQTKISNCIS